MSEATPTLPDRIARWIDAEGGDHALLLITVDGALRPHVMMLARDEVFVASPVLVRVAVSEGSQTATNLRLRASATLAIYDAGLACIVKTRVTDGPRALFPGTSACDLTVEDVRFDVPISDEGSARLVSGLSFEVRKARANVRETLAKLAR